MPDLIPPAGYIPVLSTVDGIEVYAPGPAPQEPQPGVVAFNCPQCGAATAFSAAQGRLTCAHCGYVQEPQHPVVGTAAAQAEFTVETVQKAAEEASHGWGKELAELECQNCGARTTLPQETLSSTCVFCGSNHVIQRQAAQDQLRPRFLIPFRLEADACRQIARQWMGNTWMTPAGLQDLAHGTAFTGLYLPYWTFDADSAADWRAEVAHDESESYYEDGEWHTRTRTVWRWESDSARCRFRNLLIPGTRRLSHTLLDEMGRFDLAGLVPYEASFLAGYGAQAYDLALEAAWERGREQMREETRLACLKQASDHRVRNFSMNLDFSGEGWRYVLLPVYLSTYMYEDKPFQVMVNGQTGAIAGQRPVDWNKVWLVIALILAPGLVLSFIGLVTAFLGIGLAIGGVGLVLFLVGVVVAMVIFFQADKLDDI